MMKKKYFTLLLALLPLSLFGKDSLKVMAYNLYRFPVQPPSNREYLLKDIVSYVQPDLLMACEIVNQDGSNRILKTAFNGLPDSFAAPKFVYCPTATGDPLQQMAYYNTRKLTLVHQEALRTIIRDINHYTFYLKGTAQEGDTVFLDAFVTHLKAGSGSSNSYLRETMADTFVKALRSVPKSHHVLLAGDFNFYSNQEGAYLIFTDTTNPIIMVDPIHRPGQWHDNRDFQAIHTQATRKSLSGFGLGGASGGMDDRFDFILMSKNLRQDSSLHFLTGSYKVVGNNGNCLNSRIDADTCPGVYPLSLRHVLFQMSDHAPVVMTLVRPGRFPTKISPIHKKEPSQIKIIGQQPVHRQIILSIPNEQQYKNKDLLVFDRLGRLLICQPVKPHQAKQIIEVSGLASGMYFIHFENKTLKFIKL